MKFRKRPVVIDAYQVTDSTDTGTGVVPMWVVNAVAAGQVELFAKHNKQCFTVHTLEGDMEGALGDWLIKGVKGELYPCKPDIFALTYEPVSEG